MTWLDEILIIIRLSRYAESCVFILNAGFITRSLILKNY